MATGNQRAKIIIDGEDRSGLAFATARRNIQSVVASARSFNAQLGPLIGSVGLLGSAISLISFKRVVDGLDAFNDIKDATGASVENISALEDVANRTGASLETVGTSLTKFNQLLNSAKPDSGAASTLKAIGLSAEELRRVDPAEALRQAAVALSKYADDGNKARIVQALFGKSLKEVAPFLKDLAAQGQLNATVTTKQAEEAEKFNKQLFQLEKNTKDAARALTSDLLPALNRGLAFARQLANGPGLGAGIFEVLKGNSFRDASKGLEFYNKKVAEVDAKIAALRDDRRPLVAAFNTEAIKDLEADKKRLEGFAQAYYEAAKATADPTGRRPGGDAPLVSAPQVIDDSDAKKAANEALATLRRIIDGNVKAIEARLAESRELIAFNENMSAALYTRGLKGLEEFYSDQDKARQENLAAIRQATDAEIAERQKLLNSPLLTGADKQSERQEVLNQIADARASLRAAEREADRESKLAALERASAVEALRDQVKQLEAEISDLAKGSSIDAEVQQIAERVRAAGRTFRQGGASDAEAQRRAAELGKLLEVQRQFNQAREEFARTTDNLRQAEEALELAQQASGTGLLESERQVTAVRKQQLEQLAQILQATRAAAGANPGNQQLQAGLREAELAFARLQQMADATKVRLDAAADNLGSGIADTLGRAAVEGGKLRDILDDIGKQIASAVAQETIVAPLRTEISNLIKGAGGRGLGTNLLGLVSGQRTDTAAAAASSTALLAVAQAATSAATALASIPFAAPGSSGIGLLGLGGLIGGGGGFGTGANFGNLDLGQFFDEGGHTGNIGRQKVAGIVHGNEYVFSAPAVSRLGVDYLERMHRAAKAGSTRGYAEGGYVGRMPRSSGGSNERPVSININQYYQGSPTRQTTEQAAAAAGREVRRALARGTA